MQLMSSYRACASVTKAVLELDLPSEIELPFELHENELHPLTGKSQLGNGLYFSSCYASPPIQRSNSSVMHLDASQVVNLICISRL